MKAKYERQIRRIAQQTLERDLGKQVKPYLGDLDPETRALIETEVASYPVREQYGDGTIENLGSQLHSIGKRVAEQLYVSVFQRMLPHAERRIEREREKLADRYARSQGIESGIKSLREQIRSGNVGTQGRHWYYWRGAETIVSLTSKEPIDVIQAIMGDEALDSSLAWLFGQIEPFTVGYMSSRFVFYVMAEKVIKIINSGIKDRKIILEAVIEEVENHREECKQEFENNYAKRTREIEVARAWLTEAKSAPPTAPKPPSNRAGSPNWERFRPGASGRCALRRAGDGAILSGDCERGTIVTGKSEVFWGYYVSIKTETKEIVGKSQGDAGTYRDALDDCNRKLALDGLILLAAGNAEGYSESALSGPAGFGYLEGHPEAVDILSRVEP